MLFMMLSLFCKHGTSVPHTTAYHTPQRTTPHIMSVLRIATELQCIRTLQQRTQVRAGLRDQAARELGPATEQRAL